MKSTQDNKTIEELLSTVLDGEASDAEVETVMTALSENPELRHLAQHYQLIGETLRDEDIAFFHVDISSRVITALANEPAPSKLSAAGTARQPMQQPASNGWNFWNSAGFAAAACITLAVLFSFRQISPNLGVNGAGVTANNALTTLEPANNSSIYQGDAILAGNPASDSITPEVQELLDFYRVQHSLPFESKGIAAHWQATWQPTGYLLSEADSMQLRFKQVDSNQYLSVLIEAGDMQPQNFAAEVEGLAIASYTYKQGDRLFYITVIGAIPLGEAERMALSVQPVKNLP